ncbi:MAG: RNase adapter RapZ [Micrococcaceae bacterium]
MNNQESELVVIAGMSGAGRSTAANALEDLGWYVIDNLPVRMLPLVHHMVRSLPESNQKLAVVVRTTGQNATGDIHKILTELRDDGMNFTLLFLDADDPVIVKRYELARRPHPFQMDSTILDGIEEERALMAPLKNMADILLDTSDLNVHQLSQETRKLFSDGEGTKLRITVMSFGFKNGLPLDANFVADVRFIPNPHWIPELRPKTGKDEEVCSYVLKQDGVEEFLDNYIAALRPVCEGYLQENKNFATFAIGCTGGKHRSVAMTQEIAQRLSAIPGVIVNVTHRDLGKE